MNQPSLIERAFELARSGDYQDVRSIRDQLRREGFTKVDAYLTGRSIGGQLKALCVAARG